MKKLTGMPALALVMVSGIAFSGVSVADQTDKVTPGDMRQGLVKSCMRAMENQQYCNCVVNAIQKHVSAEHVNHYEDGTAHMSPDLPAETREKMLPDAKECHVKHIGDSTG